MNQTRVLHNGTIVLQSGVYYLKYGVALTDDYPYPFHFIASPANTVGIVGHFLLEERPYEDSFIGLNFVPDVSHERPVQRAVTIQSTPKTLFRFCRFIDQHSDAEGGAMAIRASSPTIESCIFTDCIIPYQLEGGDMWIDMGSHPVIRDCQFVSNIPQFVGNKPSVLSGGAIHLQDSSITLIRTSFRGFSALFGGALSVRVTNGRSPTLFLEGCLFQFNFALFGGAIFMTNMSAYSHTLRDPLAAGRRALALAAAELHDAEPPESETALGRLYDALEAHADVLAGTPRNASSPDSPLRIVRPEPRPDAPPPAWGTSQPTGQPEPNAVVVRNTVFHVNVAPMGGTLGVVSWRGRAQFEGCTLQGLVALSLLDSLVGGAAFVLDSAPAFTDCHFTQGTAYFGGGVALFGISGAACVLTNCTFSHNRARLGGGLVSMSPFATVSAPIIARCKFDSNFASRGGAMHVYSHNKQTSESGVAVLPPCLVGRAVQVVTVESSSFVRNTAAHSGGALDIELQGGTRQLACTLRGNRFERNRARDGTLYLSEIATPGPLPSNLFEVRDCEFVHNEVSEDGGCINGDRIRIDIHHTRFRGNRAGNGGALSLKGAIACMERCHASENHGSAGGAMGISNTTLRMHDCTFTKNIAFTGACLLAFGSNCRLTHVHMLDNTARSTGGALQLRRATLECTKCYVFNNEAMLGGGFLAEYRSHLTLRNTTFEHNSAQSSGGAVFVTNSSLRIHDTVIHTNEAAQGGGIVIANASSLAAHNARFFLNVVSNLGGALLISESTAALHHCRFRSNTAEIGAAIHTRFSVLLVDGGYIRKNAANIYGGGVYGVLSSVHFRDLLIAHNRARYLGGGASIQQSRGGSSFVRTVFHHNEANQGGGGATLTGGEIEVANCTFRANACPISRRITSFHFLGGGLRVARRAKDTNTTVRIRHSTFHNNSDGALVLISHESMAPDVRVENSAFDANHVPCKVQYHGVCAANIECLGSRLAIDNATRDRMLGPSNSTWIACRECICGPGICDMPAPSHQLSVGAQSPSIRLATFREPLIPLNPSCHIVYEDTQRYVPAVAAPTHAECPLFNLKFNTFAGDSVRIRISHDNVTFSQWARLTILPDPGLIALLIGLGVGLVIIGAIVVTIIVLVCRRWQSLRRATQIELIELRKAQLAKVNLQSLKFLEKVGQGGTGEVFRAKLHGTEVAVKRLFAFKHVDPQNVAQFRQECALMKTMRHPSIVLFIGATHEQPYLIVTEYMARGSLYHIMRQRPLPSLEQRIRMALDAARGMLYLHTLVPPIIHRDLKSLNLLVNRRFEVKVADFGLSRLEEEDAHHATHFSGTPAWTAPEVLGGGSSTAESDVWSFGVILWELVTGEVPYNELRPVQIPIKVLNEGYRLEPPEHCPIGLAALIRACFATNPKQRPPFARIVGLLESELSGAPMPPPPRLTHHVGPRVCRTLQDAPAVHMEAIPTYDPISLNGAALRGDRDHSLNTPLLREG